MRTCVPGFQLFSHQFVLAKLATTYQHIRVNQGHGFVFAPINAIGTTAYAILTYLIYKT